MNGEALERIPCDYAAGCPVAKTKGGCGEDTHHRFWPASIYKTLIDVIFRELSSNKVEICRRLHEEIHDGDPPEKPSRKFMVRAINRTNQKRRKMMRATAEQRR
ncbi:hypothetical protein FWG95_01685 [Candidatus Saccharibacteria bacterium]|nr:hypothetical protein [Candidatus Saccharibacteria bacterium]